MPVNLLRTIDGFLGNVDRNPIFTFFFRNIRANAFGMMRICWAGITMLYLLFQWKDVAYYYSNEGIMNHAMEAIYVRSNWRFTILEYVDQPLAVHCLYLVLIILLFCTMIGMRTRVSLIASGILLFMFHERNPFILGGGDTLLRSIAFILMIAPGSTALSVDRARQGWNDWKMNRALLPVMTMPIWPWRLLLWQMIVLYATSTWTKLLGTMWMDGTAIQSTLHHPLFARLPFWMIDPFMPILPMVNWLALAFQALWLLLLVPKHLTDRLPAVFPCIPLRRILLVGGILFHGGIYVLMDAGVFSLAVFIAYIGLLRADDVEWLKISIGHQPLATSDQRLEARGSTVVLYDGHCGLCMRSMYTLLQCDWFHVLKPVDFRKFDDRRAFAPGITENKLDKAMHIRLPDGSYLTGFDAFRYMTGKLPALWFIYPVLWIPGIPTIGRRVYAHIAESRKKCDHENCAI